MNTAWAESALLRPFAHRDFRLLWLGQTVSNLGNSIYAIAAPFQVFDLGGGALELAQLVIVSSLATVACGLLGGAVVDRVPRRHVILMSDLSCGVMVAGVALLSATRQLRFEHLVAFSAIFGASGTLLGPALTAITPELVPADILQSSNALRSASRQVARVLGPLAGGAVVLAAGPALAFALDALSFLVSFIALSYTGPTRSDSIPTTPLLRQVRDGLAFVFHVPWLWISIFGFALINVGHAASLSVALPLYARDVLGGAAGYAVLNVAMGIGQILATIVLGHWVVRRRSGIAMYGIAVLGGLSLMLVGATRLLVVAILGAALWGAHVVAFYILWDTALQRYVPRELLGRVVSLDLFGGQLLGPLAPLLGAVSVTAFGAPGTLVIAGCWAGALAFAAIFVPSIRTLE